jgi:DNA-binding CsgD family transcriptional regulator
VLAWLGDLEAASTDAKDALERSIDYGCGLDEIAAQSVLGLVALSGGDADAAVRHLRPAAHLLRAMGIEEPGMFSLTSDLAEALVAVGHVEEAETLARRMREQGARLDRPVARGAAARCLGLVAAARGRLDEALAELDAAVKEHEVAVQPLEHARSLLVRGEILRRAMRRRAARETLRASAQLFHGAGAPVWVARAHAAAARIGGRAQSPVELTPTEAQVAALVAAGKTNAEVAADLFVSVKTVEANLSRVYRKLGVRSRRELPTALRRRSNQRQT